MGMAADPARDGTPASWRDEAAADRVARQVDAVAHAELLEDVRPVAVDRLAADDQHLRDLVARVALRDELDHFDLARGQRVQRGRLTAPRAVEIIAHERADGSGIQERLAAHRGPAGVDEVAVRSGL